MAEQVMVIRLPEELSRRARAYVESGSSGYRTIQEFIAVAIQNQLSLEGVALPQAEFERLTDTESVLKAPAPNPPSLLDAVDAVDQPLFVLSNRLSPLKIAARVLANLGVMRQWPTVDDFQRRAALAARALGLRLRSEDVQQKRSGPARRWVAFPVGDGLESAIARFVNSFTLWPDGERAGGPMAVLGLAGVREGRAVLSDTGCDLAVMPSPLLGEAQGNTLSEQEAALLRRAIASSPSERSEVRLFLDTVESTRGAQAAIDRKLLAAHGDWSERRAAAQRSAMIGRLSELGVLSVEGRGPRGRVKLLEAAADLAELLKE